MPQRSSAAFAIACVSLALETSVWMNSPSPPAAAIGRDGESEYALAQRLISLLSPGSLLLAHALLVEARCAAGERAAVEVWRISFASTLRLVRALWTMLEIGEGLDTAA